MPASRCCFSSSDGRCLNRDDRKPSGAELSFFRLPAYGKSRNINGVDYAPSQLQKWRERLVHAMTSDSNERKNMFGDPEAKICSHHFLASQFFVTGRGRQLKYGELPYGKDSVQIHHSPATLPPIVRAEVQGVLQILTSPPGQLIKRARLAPLATPSTTPLCNSILKRGFSALSSSTSPSIPPVTLPKGASSPQVQLHRSLSRMSEEMETLRVTIVSQQQALTVSRTEVQTLQAALAAERQLRMETQAAFERLCAEQGLAVDYFYAKITELLPRDEKSAGLPHKFDYISYNRLKKDPAYLNNVRLLTGWISVRLLDKFFDAILVVTKGILPRRYKAHRQSTTRTSTLSVDEHRNYYFFTLYVLRTGPASFNLVAINFGFERTAASHWYTSWLRTIKLVLARLMPQLTLEATRKSNPSHMVKKFGLNLAGILDCLEQECQVASELMAQRATWSDYKSCNTSKYLVDCKPAGFTGYVSPGYPGRITDVQICHCVAYYDLDDAHIDAIISELPEEEAEE